MKSYATFELYTEYLNTNSRIGSHWSTVGLSSRQSYFSIMATVISKTCFTVTSFGLSGNRIMQLWHEKCLLKACLLRPVFPPTSYLVDFFVSGEHTAFPVGFQCKTVLGVNIHYLNMYIRVHQAGEAAWLVRSTEFHHIWMSSPPCRGPAARGGLGWGDSQKSSPGPSSCSPSSESCLPSSSSPRNLEEHASQWVFSNKNSIKHISYSQVKLAGHIHIS